MVSYICLTIKNMRRASRALNRRNEAQVQPSQFRPAAILLSSELYCRYRNHTSSAYARGLTAGRELHPCPEDIWWQHCCHVKLLCTYYTSNMVGCKEAFFLLR